jgi:hypothetical protein
MLFKEILSINIENHTKQINAWLFVVKELVHISNIRPQSVK